MTSFLSFFAVAISCGVTFFVDKLCRSSSQPVLPRFEPVLDGIEPVTTTATAEVATDNTANITSDPTTDTVAVPHSPVETNDASTVGPDQGNVTPTVDLDVEVPIRPRRRVLHFSTGTSCLRSSGTRSLENEQRTLGRTIPPTLPCRRPTVLREAAFFAPTPPLPLAFCQTRSPIPSSSGTPSPSPSPVRTPSSPRSPSLSGSGPSVELLTAALSRLRPLDDNSDEDHGRPSWSATFTRYRSPVRSVASSCESSRLSSRSSSPPPSPSTSESSDELSALGAAFAALRVSDRPALVARASAPAPGDLVLVAPHSPTTKNNIIDSPSEEKEVESTVKQTTPVPSEPAPSSEVMNSEEPATTPAPIVEGSGPEPDVMEGAEKQEDSEESMVVPPPAIPIAPAATSATVSGPVPIPTFVAGSPEPGPTSTTSPSSSMPATIASPLGERDSSMQGVEATGIHAVAIPNDSMEVEEENEEGQAGRMEADHADNEQMEGLDTSSGMEGVELQQTLAQMTYPTEILAGVSQMAGSHVNAAGGQTIDREVDMAEAAEVVAFTERNAVNPVQPSIETFRPQPVTARQWTTTSAGMIVQAPRRPAAAVPAAGPSASTSAAQGSSQVAGSTPTPARPRAVTANPLSSMNHDALQRQIGRFDANLQEASRAMRRLSEAGLNPGPQASAAMEELATFGRNAVQFAPTRPNWGAALWRRAQRQNIQGFRDLANTIAQTRPEVRSLAASLQGLVDHFSPPAPAPTTAAATPAASTSSAAASAGSQQQQGQQPSAGAGTKRKAAEDERPSQRRAVAAGPSAPSSSGSAPARIAVPVTEEVSAGPQEQQQEQQQQQQRQPSPGAGSKRKAADEGARPARRHADAAAGPSTPAPEPSAPAPSVSAPERTAVPVTDESSDSQQQTQHPEQQPLSGAGTKRKAAGDDRATRRRAIATEDVSTTAAGTGPAPAPSPPVPVQPLAAPTRAAVRVRPEPSGSEQQQPVAPFTGAGSKRKATGEESESRRRAVAADEEGA